RVRDTLTTIYNAAPTINGKPTLESLGAKAQLLAAMRYLYDPGLLPFFLSQGMDKDLHPDVRMVAVRGYALLANKEEALALKQAIAKEPSSEDGGFRENFAQNNPAIDAAVACDVDVACW